MGKLPKNLTRLARLARLTRMQALALRRSLLLAPSGKRSGGRAVSGQFKTSYPRTGCPGFVRLLSTTRRTVFWAEGEEGRDKKEGRGKMEEGKNKKVEEETRSSSLSPCSDGQPLDRLSLSTVGPCHYLVGPLLLVKTKVLSLARARYFIHVLLFLHIVRVQQPVSQC